MPVADPLVLAIDQGTGSTKAVLVDALGRVVGRGSASLGQTHPAPGWVEQDAGLIWASVQRAVEVCLGDQVQSASRVVAVGLSTQRESVVLWERASGRPLGPLISWQDQRTAARAKELLTAGHGDRVEATTGLPLDPMFSALKASWLLDHHDPARERARHGELCVGTVDAWLLSRFGGEAVIELGNASRTQLLDIRTGQWDENLLALFDIPLAALPTVVASDGPFPAVRGLAPLADGVPVLGVLGDSHAALFAHAGWSAGVIKATYGTGSSVMAVSLDDRPPLGGICQTVAWHVGGGAHTLALEANIRSTGRTLTWLAALFQVPIDALIEEAIGAGSEGVVLVPAFGGLGAPWWDPAATPLLSGFSLGTGRAQVARAALESVAFQVSDVVDALGSHLGRAPVVVADGGLSRNDSVLQLQADVTGVPVRRSVDVDLSARGAADLAGLAAGLWTREELAARDRGGDLFTPTADPRDARLAADAWHREIDRARHRGPALTPATADGGPRS